MAAGCCVGSSCRFPAAPGLEESNRLEGEEPNAAGGQGLGWQGLQGPPPRAENPLECRGVAPGIGSCVPWSPPRNGPGLEPSLALTVSQGTTVSGTTLHQPLAGRRACAARGSSAG